MTDLQGRALDANVASILGTTGTYDTNPAGVPYIRTGMEDPRYSTDPATQAEMLAWLDKGGSYNVDIKCNCPYQTYAGHPRRIFAELTNCTAPHVIVNVANGAGMTINEALARLVVAVAAREGQP